MAITFTGFKNINSSTDATSYATTSGTPTAGTVVFLFVSSQKGTLPDVPVPGAAWGITAWNDITNITFNSSQRRLYAFWGYADTYSAGTCTIDFTNTQLGCAAGFFLAAGVSTTAPVVDSDTDSGTGTALAALGVGAFADATNNASLVSICHNASETPTITGYSEINDLSAPGSPIYNMNNSYLIGEDTSVAASWATSSAFGAIQIEVRVAATVAATSTSVRTVRRRRR